MTCEILGGEGRQGRRKAEIANKGKDMSKGVWYLRRMERDVRRTVSRFVMLDTRVEGA